MVITAKEARELAGPTDAELAEKALETAFREIRFAADERKQRSIHFRNDFWARGGYDDAKSYKIAVERLKELGFDVNFFYDKFDTGVVISW